MMYTVDNTAATNANLSDLQCNTEYTVWVQAKCGRTGKTSVFRTVFLPARGMYLCCNLLSLLWLTIYINYITPAPPTPTEITAQFTNASSVRVSWQHHPCDLLF